MNYQVYTAGYLQLLSEGLLAEKVERAQKLLTCCTGCGWHCKVDRWTDKLGVCSTGIDARVSNFGQHMGEEKVLSGWWGSGTIFFSRCNMRCQFCQNFEISQSSNGKLVSAEELAEIMLVLQDRGCHNINLVSPTHVGPQILAAVEIAANNGLYLPLVWNSGGYDSLDLLELLDGVIDIYMPDMKYANPSVALHYSKIPHYPQTNQAAVKEMYRQVGDLSFDSQGIAVRGLLVRHLVLPDNLAGTQAIMQFLATEISTETYVNVMDQYHPCWRADAFPKLKRGITRKEYEEALNLAYEAGLHRLDQLN